MDNIIKSSIFPLFFVSTYEDLIRRMTYGSFIYAAAISCYPKAAPYGRHTKSAIGVPAKIAWVIQESPSFFIPLLISLYGDRKSYKSISNQFCLGLFVMHYFQRTFIYGILLKSKRDMPIMPFFFAFLTCTYNGLLHGIYFVTYEPYNDAMWLKKPFFWIGIFMYMCGMYINIGSDSILRSLRSGTDDNYKIPTGGMFKYISCANYFGEIVEMWGYAIASMAPPAISHAIFTTAFLGQRAIQHHRWYLKKFEDYPKNRKAVIPFIL